MDAVAREGEDGGVEEESGCDGQELEAVGGADEGVV